MAKRVFRPDAPDQPLPLPPDLRQWLPADHAVYLLGDILDQRDLTPILASDERGDGGGNPPYHPLLLTKLLLYAYCEGVVSSRAIAAKTYSDIAFRVLTADQHPDFRTSSACRERHLPALTDLFVQVVRLAGHLGLTKLEHVAQDGAKILANAAKHRAMRDGRMRQAEDRVGRAIPALLAAAQAADAGEDAAHGVERSGDEPPPDLSGAVARRERRLAAIRAAKAALEAEARGEAEAMRAAAAAARQHRAATGAPQQPGRVPDPAGVPADTAQRHCTDPESRIMPNADQASVQAYNGQIAVDGGGQQSIVGWLLTNQRADPAHLAPLLDHVRAVTGRLPGAWSADAGDCSAANSAAVARAGGTPSIPPARQAHAAQPPPAVARLLGEAGLGPAADAGAGEEHAVQAALRARLATEAGRRADARRKQPVAPVCGQRKERRGLRRFLRRGRDKVRAEWTLWCLTHHLCTLLGALRRSAALRQRLAA